MKKYRIRNIIEKSYNEFEATYKKHLIRITREEVFMFYIQVSNNEGIYSYDGYYDSDTGSMDEAIEQALEGAMLI